MLLSVPDQVKCTCSFGTFIVAMPFPASKGVEASRNAMFACWESLSLQIHLRGKQLHGCSDVQQENRAQLLKNVCAA